MIVINALSCRIPCGFVRILKLIWVIEEDFGRFFVIRITDSIYMYPMSLKYLKNRVLV